MKKISWGIFLLLLVMFSYSNPIEVGHGMFINSTDTLSNNDSSTIYFEKVISFEKKNKCFLQVNKISYKRNLPGNGVEDIIKYLSENVTVILRYEGDFIQKNDSIVVNLHLIQNNSSTKEIDSILKLNLSMINNKKLYLPTKKMFFYWTLK